MTKQKFDRRDILRGAVVGGAAAASATGGIAQPQNAHAQQPMVAPVASDAAGYAFFNLEEAAFIEALVDHMFNEFDGLTDHIGKACSETRMLKSFNCAF